MFLLISEECVKDDKKKTILQKIKENITNKEEEIYKELVERLRRYYEEDWIINKSHMKEIFEYAYIKEKIYSYEEIGEVVGYVRSTIYVVILKIEGQIKNLLDYERKYGKLKIIP